MLNTVNVFDKPSDASSEKNDPTKFRMNRIKLAVITSIGSKMMMVLVQLLAMPIAIRALGLERFGAYAALSGMIAWINLANVGIGPGLTLKIASASAKGDRDEESRSFWSAIILIASVLVVVSISLMITFRFVSIDGLLGPKYIHYKSEMISGLYVLFVLVCANLLLSVVEATQAGYQNIHINNVFGTVGNLATFAMLFLLVSRWHTISGMIIATSGAVTLAKTCNLIALLGKRPYLLSRFGVFDKAICKMLAGTGVSYMAGMIAVILVQEASVFLVGRQLGLKAAAGYAIMMQVYTLSIGMIRMVTVPMISAVADAHIRGHISWIKGAFRRVQYYTMSYAIITGLIVAFLGDPLIRMWIGPKAVPPYALHLVFGLSFPFVMWEHIYYTILVGMGRFHIPALVMLIGSIFGISASFWLMSVYGSAGMAMAVYSGKVAICSWLFPILFNRAINYKHTAAKQQDVNTS